GVPLCMHVFEQHAMRVVLGVCRVMLAWVDRQVAGLAAFRARLCGRLQGRDCAGRRRFVSFDATDASEPKGCEQGNCTSLSEACRWKNWPFWSSRKPLGGHGCSP
ncbi:MAG: hypothetical protein ACI9QQ_002566, partial [Myxococcota bacterium]